MNGGQPVTFMRCRTFESLSPSTNWRSRMSRKPLALATLAAVAILTPLALHAQAGPYKVLRTVKVGGDGGMDYVTTDSANRTLYVARSGAAGHIGVFNLDTFAQVGDIPNTSAHGAIVDDATGHGFATSRAITMFDAKTFAVIKTIPVEGNPDGYFNDWVNHRFYDLSHSAPDITVIDDKDGSILTTIDIGGAPEQGQFDGKNRIYVDIEDKDAIAVIDATTMKMIGKYDLSAKSGGCAGLALDAKNNILFAACRKNNDMVILSATDGHIIADLPTGQGCDGATFNPDTMEAFSSQGDGTLTVIKENSPTSFAVEQTVTTPVRAKTITLDTKTGHLLLITAEYGPAPAPATPPAAAPGAAPAAGGPPGGFRSPRAPMIPGSFEIVVVGK
jgi:outer membrane protein assembly factor BamB